MKRIFTLLTVGLFYLTSKPANAQTITENFENNVPTGNCWTNIDFKREKNVGTGNSDVASTKGVATATLTTPFIEVTANGTIQFDYKAIDNSVGHSLTVNIISKTGAATQLSNFTITNASGYLHYTSSTLTAGTYRVSLTYTSTAGSPGNNYILIDNLAISGAFHYSSFCNSAPTANDDTYGKPTITAVSDNLLNNDSDPNSISPYFEKISLTSVVQPASGTVSFNANGNFKFIFWK